MKLIDREKAMLILDKRICWSASVFNGVDEWKDCKSELKLFCIKCCVETNSYERSNMHANDDYQQSSEHTDTDEDDSDQDSDVDARFSFQRTVENESPLKNRNGTEVSKGLDDAKAADKEHERVLANWVEHKVKWEKLCSEK